MEREGTPTGTASCSPRKGAWSATTAVASRRRSAITEHLRSIFGDHHPATYVAQVREVRPLGPGAALLRSIVGMVPPGKADINPGVNAVQTRGGRE